MEKTKIYSGFFCKWRGFPRHVTWDFNPGACGLPEGVKEGDCVDIYAVGIYEDPEVTALAVTVKLSDGSVLTHQKGSKTPLHITLRADGVPPVESGIRMKEHGWHPMPPFKIPAKAGFFRAPSRE